MPKYGIISGPYFPVFGLNMEIYVVNQSEYRKIRTRNDSIFGNFSRSDSKRKKAVSPKVMRDISTKSPKTMELFGIPPPL